jgi:nucleoside-diphosphate-sugar epimerase
MTTVAITGGTGFIGRHVIAALTGSGQSLRLLMRNPAPGTLSCGNAEIIRGTLADRDALARLVDGADTVIHCAGAIGAADRSAFASANIDGTRALAAAAAAAGVRRFVHLSSIAAREPALTDYAWSKAGSEMALAAELPAPSFVILRPPAVYGPGDRATLPLIRQLLQPLVVLPVAADQRVSLIFVRDLAAAIIGVAGAPSCPGGPFELSDGTPGGYSWPDLVREAARQSGRSQRTLFLPPPLARLTARAAMLAARLSGGPPMLTLGKLPELYHRDWVSHAEGLDAVTGWRPHVAFAEGLATTLDWYRREGWLPRTRPATRNPLGLGQQQGGRR